MGKNFTYVDNSNAYIEGCRVSAVAEKFNGASDIYAAMNNGIVNGLWQLDYGRLYIFACGGNEESIGHAKLWGSPPPGDSFWKMLERIGFKVTTFDRNFAGKEKKVDVAIGHAITKDVYSGAIDKEQDTITLISGDKDYVPVVEDVVNFGCTVDVVFWNHAAEELKRSASKFISLDPHIDYFTR